MQTIMNNALTDYSGPWSKSHATCPMCADDETVSEKDRTKVWTSQANLNRHMEGTFHSPKLRWERRMKLQHQQNPSAGWPCPYCENSTKYTKLNDLERHIRSTTQKPSDPRHERLKAEDGWFEADWMGRASTEMERSRERKIKRNVKAFGGVDYVDGLPELLNAQSVPGPANIVRRGPSFEVPSWSMVGNTYDRPALFGSIPPHAQSRIKFVESRAPAFDHLTKFVDRPVPFKDKDINNTHFPS